MNYQTVDLVKMVLAVLLLALLLTVGTRRLSRTTRVLLAALALLSVANFHHFGFFHTRHLNYGWLNQRAYLHLWDLYHYYIGAKYFDELGYRGIYNATVAADADAADGNGDGGRLAGVIMVRDLDESGFLSREQVLSRSRDARARFSHQRWRDFTADVSYFTQRLPPGLMAKLLLDHGYNPTPAWNTTGSFLANRVPVEKLWSLALLDAALLVAGALAIGVAFGGETALVAAAFFGINAFAAFSMTGGSFLRYDWLLALVLSLCLLHRRRFAGAGFFLGYAALVRIFPALLLAGLVAKAAYETARDRVFPPRFARLFLSFLVASLLFLGYGSLSGRGPGAWGEFAGRITAHYRTIGANSVGFAMVFLYDGTWEDSLSFAEAYGTTAEPADSVVNRVKGAEADARRGMFLFYCLSILTLGAFAAIGRTDEEALAWGAVPVFMLLNLSNYYFVFLVINAVVWYRGWRRNPAPLALLLAAQVAVLWIEISVDFPLRATALSSLVFFLFVLALLSVELIGNRKRIGRRLAALTGRE